MSMNEKMFIVKKRTSLLSLILISVFCSFSLESGGFYFVNQQKKYNEAKTYCRDMYMDLATVHSFTEMNYTITSNSLTSEKAWIGLEFGSEWVWIWSLSEQVNFSNWNSGEGQIKNKEGCAATYGNGTWFESDCERLFTFICHGKAGASSHIFVNESKTWRDARRHCWSLSTDLVTINSAEENRAIRNMTASKNVPSVWIGLFRDPWKWSDGSYSSFRFWGASQPSYNSNQKCVTAVFTDQGQWVDQNCNNKNSFICYAQTPTPATASSQSTQGSIATDQLSAKMTTISQSSSPGFTATSHYTAAAAEKQNTTTVTAPAPTTASGSTTESFSRPSSTELSSSARTETTVKSTQILPKSTISGTTVSVPASAAQVGTSGTGTTQPTAAQSPDVLSENLILIQRNLPWLEALSYCREHHTDLVHVTSKDIQDNVAQMVKNSTSPHVWLGLRYSCNFKFWFWAGSTSGCYQNWVPGEGPERMYECGVSGAVEATGGQQWVGLPETQELNFICSACAG